MSLYGGRFFRLCVCVLVAWVTGSRVCAGQEPLSSDGTSRFDKYGNARGAAGLWRPGVNDAFGTNVSGIQGLPLSYRPSGLAALRRSEREAVGWLPGLGGSTLSTGFVRQAGNISGRRMGLTSSSVSARPASLAGIRPWPFGAAGSYRAPLARLGTYQGLPLGRRATVRQPLSAIHAGPTLGRFIQADNIAAYDRIRSKAWGLFRTGEFRSASYAFEAALALAPRDAVCQLGIIFCEVSFTRYRAAAIRMNSYLTAGAEAALGRPVEMERQFGSPAAYERSRHGLERFSEAHGNDDSVVALLAFFLWHGGQGEDAVKVADRIARQRPNSPYAGLARLILSATRRTGESPAPHGATAPWEQNTDRHE